MLQNLLVQSYFNIRLRLHLNLRLRFSLVQTKTDSCMKIYMLRMYQGWIGFPKALPDLPDPDVILFYSNIFHPASICLFGKHTPLCYGWSTDLLESNHIPLFPTPLVWAKRSLWACIYLLSSSFLKSYLKLPLLNKQFNHGPAELIFQERSQHLREFD